MTPEEAQLAARVFAQTADENGWRDYPDDLSRKDSSALNRWWRRGWIDLEEAPVLRITPAGRQALSPEREGGADG